jgi:hypothetical protein
MADEEVVTEQVSFLTGIYQEIVNSPLNIALIAIITFLIFKIFKSRQPPKPSAPSEPELPKMRRDFTVAELKAFDGNQPDGRVLVAVNGTVYDVSRGKRFYGPGKAPVELRLVFKVPIDLMLTHCDSLLASLHSFILAVLLLDDETPNCDTRSTFHIPVRKLFLLSTLIRACCSLGMRLQLATSLRLCWSEGRNNNSWCNANCHSFLCNV